MDSRPGTRPDRVGVNAPGVCGTQNRLTIYRLVPPARAKESVTFDSYVPWLPDTVLMGHSNCTARFRECYGLLAEVWLTGHCDHVSGYRVDENDQNLLQTGALL